jgi:hypothetical protein
MTALMGQMPGEHPAFQIVVISHFRKNFAPIRIYKMLAFTKADAATLVDLLHASIAPPSSSAMFFIASTSWARLSSKKTAFYVDVQRRFVDKVKADSDHDRSSYKHGIVSSRRSLLR